jgi:hypothetical protein
MLLKANYECVSYCYQPVISTTHDNASFYIGFIAKTKSYF